MRSQQLLGRVWPHRGGAWALGWGRRLLHQVHCKTLTFVQIMIKLFWRRCRPGNLCSHGQVEPLFAEPVNRNLTLGHLWHWKIPQGTCHSDYDCVSPGFHICIENCTDRSLQNGRMNENGRPPSEGLLTPSERLKAFVILSPLFILYKYFSSNLSLINLFSKPTFEQYILWDLPFLKYQTAWNLSLTHISWTIFPQISLTNIIDKYISSNLSF